MTTAEKFYIENNLDKSAADLATELKLKEKDVEKFIKTSLALKNTGHFVKKDEQGKSKGVIVATAGSSQRGDSASKASPPGRPNHIHKIHPNR